MVDAMIIGNLFTLLLCCRSTEDCQRQCRKAFHPPICPKRG
jgi:hypothetical protein